MEIHNQILMYMFGSHKTKHYNNWKISWNNIMLYKFFFRNAWILNIQRVGENVSSLNSEEKNEHQNLMLRFIYLFPDGQPLQQWTYQLCIMFRNGFRDDANHPGRTSIHIKQTMNSEKRTTIWCWWIDSEDSEERNSYNKSWRISCTYVILCAQFLQYHIQLETR